jgi:hypothetical protein
MSVNCKSRWISKHERDGLTKTGQELWIGKAFCEAAGGRICSCGVVEGVQGRCEGGEDCAWIVAVSYYADRGLDGCVDLP